MKKSELPPDIEGIREMVAQYLYEKFESWADMKWKQLHKRTKDYWRERATELLSKLTEHGVVVLVEKVSDILDAYKVINLDGTPKEG